MRIPHPRSPVVLSLVLVALLAGCRGGDGTSEPPPGPATQTVTVHFTNLELGEIGEVHPVERETTEDDLPRAALQALVAGPTPDEEADGYSSWFSEGTADAVLDLEIVDGVAAVDFVADLPERIPGASTSAGSTALLAELDATLTQFPAIGDTRYALAGDVDAFYAWLQRDPSGGQASPPSPPDDGDGTDADAPPAEAAAGSEVTVSVFFTNPQRGADTEVFATPRTVPGPAVLRGTLEALLAGPTEQEREDGYDSWFSARTAGMLQDVRIADGVAHVDLAADLPEIIPNASTSAGSTVLLAALDATATQFATVDTVICSLDGDVDAFYEWLQRDSPS